MSRLLDQIREAMRTAHYSYRTEQTYVHRIRRFILFHHKRHPAEMGEHEIAQFLNYLANTEHVSGVDKLVGIYRERSLAWNTRDFVRSVGRRVRSSVDNLESRQGTP